MKKKKDDYITLKQAAEISGYSSDYLGQLIRQGKLNGKQVFSQVSWVVTEDALHAYMKKGKTESGYGGDRLGNILKKLLTPESLSVAYVVVAKGVVILLVLFLLLLVYVFSVSIDHRVGETLSERSDYAP